jgi:nucleotide-binding universal stress UspA family protein
MFQNILVPLDGSEVAEAALECARYLATVSKGHLHLVQVPNSKANLADWDEATPAEQAEENECMEYLEKVAAPLRAEGLRVTCEVLESGPAAERILEVVEDDDLDLVVLTSHGRSGLSRVLLGSVADTVSRQSRSPVLIVGRRSDVVGRVKDQIKARRQNQKTSQ